jgi:hypothetical protein
VLRNPQKIEMTWLLFSGLYTAELRSAGTCRRYFPIWSRLFLALA